MSGRSCHWRDYIRVYCCYIRVNTLNEFLSIRVDIRVTLFVYNVTFAKGINHSNPIKTALVTTFGSIKGT